MVKVAAVFGLSGVGKGWLISRYASSHAVLHIQASQLLCEAKVSRCGHWAIEYQAATATLARFVPIEPGNHPRAG